MKPTLIVIVGPTGIGKTDLSLEIAEKYGSPILSADSRQIFSELHIGTASPTPEQLARVKHYFIATHTLSNYYSASLFEEEVLSLGNELFPKQPVLLMTGGSMLYVDAVCKGIDELPTITDQVRCDLYERYRLAGIDPLLEELKETDPIYYEQVDRNNHKRVIHALEIIYMTGKPYSALRTNTRKERPFEIIKIGLRRDRVELFSRINDRVDSMINDGLVEEAQSVLHLRNLNSLNTVGYKEIFSYFDGIWDLETAVEKIKRNTRVYAKKQMTWFNKDTEITWFHPDEKEAIIEFIDRHLKD